MRTAKHEGRAQPQPALLGQALARSSRSTRTVSGRSLARATVAMVGLLAGLVAPTGAHAQCPGTPELTELSIMVHAIVLDETGELDVDRYYEAYADDYLSHPRDRLPRTVSRWTLRRTWRPGEPWLEIPVIATETSQVQLEVRVGGSCIGELVQVSGPEFFAGSGRFNCVDCAFSRPVYLLDPNILPPHWPAYGRAHFVVYSLLGEEMAQFFMDLEVHDAGVRVSYGPGVSVQGTAPFVPNTYFGYSNGSDYPPDGDVIGVSEPYSDPIVSRCWAGPWTFADLRLLDRNWWTTLSPPAPSQGSSWVTNYICRSYATCLPREVKMDVRGDIPPSLPPTATPELNNSDPYLWYASGTYSTLEFAPTEDEIGEWNMMIECRDNEGNYHERPWRVIVTKGPELPSESCVGCTGVGWPWSLNPWWIVVGAVLVARRRT